MKRFAYAITTLIVLGLAVPSGLLAEDPVYSVYPIGFVKKHDGKTELIIDKKHIDGLKGLGDFSHVIVFYWFDKNDSPQKRSILQVPPGGDNSASTAGVFATRAPVRPNLIGMTVCKIVSVKDNIVEIDDIDAFENSPIIDLKPYIPKIDSIPSAAAPDWIKKHKHKK